MDERREFTEILIEDHGEAEGIFAEIERISAEGQAPDTLGKVRELTEQVITELVKHSVAEEEYLYPAARKHLPNGDEIADMEISEHALAEETMKELDGMSPSNLDYLTKVRKLAGQIREHAGKEEADLFPALASMMSPEERLELGQKIEKAKSMAPTHPHPSAPDRPPMNKLLGPGVALVDRVRDAISSHKR
jgi:hemerythrin superfamily protein